MLGTAWEQVGEERREEHLLERWRYLLDLYQEQPHLLDPHLPQILGKRYVHIIIIIAVLQIPEILKSNKSYKIRQFW